MGNRLPATDRIHRVVFELEFADNGRTGATQERISAFCRLDLNDALEAGLRMLPDDAAPLVLERLELKLGSLDPAAPERGLARRITGALAHALGELALARQPAWEAPSGTAAQPSSQLAAFFAGGEHWPRERADRVMREALARMPSTLAQLLCKHGRDARQRHTLAHVLSRPVIEALVRLLDESAAPLVIAYVDDLVRVQRSRPVVPATGPGFEPALWELVLAHLLEQRGSRFNTRSFIGATVQRMAQRYRLDYHELLGHLARVAATLALPSAARYSLPAVLAELQAAAPQPDAIAPGQVDAQDPHTDLAALALFFERGLLPMPAARGHAAERMICRLLERDGAALAALLRRAGAREAARQRLVDAVREPVLEQVVCLLEPAHGTLIVGYLHQLRAAPAPQALPARDGGGYARDLWQVVFSCLLAERGSVFNTRSFVRQLLTRMAARHGVSYRALLLDLATHALPDHNPVSLPAVLLWLAEEELLGMAASAPAPLATLAAPPEGSGTGAQAALERLLLHGVRPEFSHLAPDAALARWLAQLPAAAIAAVLRRHSDSRAAIERTAWQFEGPLRDRALAALGGPMSAPVAGLRAALRAVCAELGADRAWLDFHLVSALARQPSGGFTIAALSAQVTALLALRLGVAHGALVRRLPAKFRPQAAPAPLPLPAAAARPPAQPAARPPMEAQALSLYYLEHGCLPAGQDGIAAATLQRLVEHGFCLGPAAGLLAALRTMPPEAIARLLRHVPASGLLRMLRAVAHANAGFVVTLMLAGAGLDASAHLGSEQRRRTADVHLRQVLRLLISDGAQANAQHVLGELAKACARELGLEHGVYLAAMHELASARRSAQPRYAALADLLSAALARAPQAPAHRSVSKRDAGPGTPIGSGRRSAAGGSVRPGANVAAAVRIAADAVPAGVKLTEAGRPQAGASAPVGDLVPAAAHAAIPGAAAGDAVDAIEQLLRYGTARLAGTSGLALAQAAGSYTPALRSLLLRAIGDDLERARLVRAWPAGSFDDLLRLLLDGGAGAAAALLRLVKEALAELAPGRASSVPADELLRQVGRAAADVAAAYLRAVVPRLAAAERLAAPALIDALERAARRHAGADARLHDTLRVLREMARGMPCAAGRDHDATIIAALFPARAAPLARHPRVFEPLPVLPAGERLHVDNAGAVLLWPFLDRYFRSLDLLSGREFRDDTCQARAARLLQYLVDGDEDPPEHVLLLNKILCGIDPTAPLAWRGAPDEPARELAQQLLHSVTKTWRVLKNTSVEGLQETFLARSGVLLREDDRWTLQVDNGPFDMLLRSLPWGLSTVRLSWMTHSLWVKWP